MKTDKRFENVNRTIIMRDLSDGLAFCNFARLVWKENILSPLIFGKKLKKEKESFLDLCILMCTDYMTMYEASTVDSSVDNSIL